MRSLPARTSVAAVVVAFSAASVTSAHEGHGHPELQTGLMHFVSSPVHLIPGLVAAGFVAGAIVFGIRRLRLQQMRKATAVRTK